MRKYGRNGAVELNENIRWKYEKASTDCQKLFDQLHDQVIAATRAPVFSTRNKDYILQFSTTGDIGRAKRVVYLDINPLRKGDRVECYVLIIGYDGSRWDDWRHIETRDLGETASESNGGGKDRWRRYRIHESQSEGAVRIMVAALNFWETY